MTRPCPQAWASLIVQDWRWNRDKPCLPIAAHGNQSGPRSHPSPAPPPAPTATATATEESWAPSTGCS